MLRASFITNPLSHSVAKDGSVLEQTAIDVDRNSYVSRYHLTDFSTLDEIVRSICSHQSEMVFIEGGDGTVHGILSEFLRQSPSFPTFPKFVLLPGGMTNLVADLAGVTTPTPQKLHALLDGETSHQLTQLPLLTLTYGSDNQAYHGFLFSTGALPKATQYCLDQVHTKGIPGAQAVRMTLLKVLFSRGEARQAILGATPYDLTTPHMHMHGNHIISVATTLPKLMIGINPFWGTEDGPVRLTYVHENASHIIRNIMRLFRKNISGKHAEALKKGGFESWDVDEAQIYHSGPMVMDGEFLPLTDGPITLSASQPLSFVSLS
jgi:diacylglycerol kinase family enzyme